MRSTARPRLASVLAWLAALPFLVAGAGFIFHTSFDPVILNKYSAGYFAFLLGWFLLVIPGAFLTGRFLGSTHHLRLSSGRRLAITPLPKILIAIAIALLLVILVDNKLLRAARRGTTVSADAFHPYLQNHPKPERPRLTTNQWGFRGDYIDQTKPAGVFRVFMLGGSTVFCGRLPYESTHGALIQARLAAQYPDVKIEVQNAGADWHTTEHSLIKFLFRIQDFEPDLVILYHGINDLCRSFEPEIFSAGEFQCDYSHYYGAAAALVDPDRTRWQLLRMRLGFWFSDFLSDRVRFVSPDASGRPAPHMLFFPKSVERDVAAWPSLDPFRRNLRECVRAVRSKDIDLILASQPYFYHDAMTDREREQIWFPHVHQKDGVRPSIRSMIAGMDLFNNSTREIASESGATFVDLEALLPKSMEYFVDDVHYTPAACEHIAEAFADAIIDAGLIEPDGR